jgi:hypothetical protein
LTAFETGERQPTLGLVYRSPPCVCGRDVIEVTHGPAAAGSKGLLEVLISVAVALLVIWLLLIAALAIGHRKSKMLQLSAAYGRFSSSDAHPDPNRSLRPKLLVLAMLVILNVVWLALLLSRAPGEPAVESTSDQGATPGELSSSGGSSPASYPSNGSAAEDTIRLADLADSAMPFEAVRIQGAYPGRPNIILRVQRLERGMWLDFPLQPKTDQSGQFTTFVEFGRPGRYWLRVVDPGSAVTSKPFVLVIKG